MKRQLDGINCLYPMPTVLVGTVVDGKPNFITIAHVGIMNFAKPHYISISPAKIHYSNRGIVENGTFSVNIPSEDMVVETDYCGIKSGKKVDKSQMFDLFYGELKGAPMISACPVTMECRLYQTLDFGTHDLFIGEVVQTYCEETVFTDGELDFAKVKPMLFDIPRKKYWRLGEPFADCWKIGLEWKAKA